MKLKLDENLGDAGRDLLEAEGYDVMTVQQQCLSGQIDTVIYDVCRDEQRVLVTLDRDFCHELRFPAGPTAGIAILDCHGPSTSSAIRARIAELVALLRVEPITGRLWIVEPGRIRIREARPG